MVTGVYMTLPQGNVTVVDCISQKFVVKIDFRDKIREQNVNTISPL